MEHLKTNQRMKVLNKIYKLKSSKESLKELKQCYNLDIKAINKDIENLRNILTEAFIQKAEQFDVKNIQEENKTEKKEEKIKFENELIELDGELKEKNRYLFKEKMELDQLNQIVLDCCSTISRILYQLDPKMSSEIQISHSNVIELLSFCGLQLEKVLSFLFIEGNIHASCANLDNIEEYNLEKDNYLKQPPSWLRIHNKI